MGWWYLYVGGWFATAVLSAGLTYVCRRVAPDLGFVDKPLKEAHKKHVKVTPVMGGAAMAAAWLLVIVAGLLGSVTCGRLVSPEVSLYLPGIQTVRPQLYAILSGAVAITALGMLDDRKRLSAAAKFAGQFAIAGAVSCWGIRITAFVDNPFLTWGMTTCWILLIVNALNFFDNMDALAGGTAAIAAFFFLFIAGVRGQHFVAMLSAVTCGTACGFLVFNRPPATIFMGDGGSHFLGYLLAVIGSLTTFYTPRESPTLAPVLIPVFVLALPIFDAAAVVVVRLSRGKPIYVGDTNHISHRFAKIGLSRSKAVLLVCLLSFVAGAGAATLLWLPLAGAVLAVVQIVAVLAIVSIVQFSIGDID